MMPSNDGAPDLQVIIWITMEPHTHRESHAGHNGASHVLVSHNGAELLFGWLSVEVDAYSY